MSDVNERLLAHHPAWHTWPQALREAELNLETPALVLAWELSGLAPLAERERLFAVILALMATQGQGHTCLALPLDPGSPAAHVMEAFGFADFEVLSFLRSPKLAPWVGGPGQTRPLILEGNTLYSHRFRQHEQSLAERVRSLVDRDPIAVKEVEEGLFTDPNPLDADQRRAVEQALRSPLTLITGGPGTGKTTIVVSILRALLRQEGMSLDRIALAAPTGKAAQRMGEAIRKALGRLAHPAPQDLALQTAGLEPRTLHRLLAWHPAAERFRHDAENPLPYQVVLVDESSMISQEHLHRLMAALSENTRLVLLGDAEQLPSVEPGCAFRDLVAGLETCAVRLRTSHRMRAEDPDGRNILSVARVINDPGSGQLWEGPEPITIRERPEDLTYRKVELWSPGWSGMPAFLDRWFQERIVALPDFRNRVTRVFRYQDGIWGDGDEEVLRRLFRHFDGSRLLCALKAAVQEINAYFHARMIGHLKWEAALRPKFCAGEPVLMTRNDYTRNLFNGDQGLVLMVNLDGSLKQASVFPHPSGFRPFLLDALREELEQAFALTVHKSQGSEYEHVAVVLPRTDHRSLSRELLYTALTRAKLSVTLIGEKERVTFAATNPVERMSGLKARLERPVELAQPSLH